MVLRVLSATIQLEYVFAGKGWRGKGASTSLSHRVGSTELLSSRFRSTIEFSHTAFPVFIAPVQVQMQIAVVQLPHWTAVAMGVPSIEAEEAAASSLSE